VTRKICFFEDYQVGESSKGVVDPPSRTINASDIVSYGCLAGDYARVHLDRHHMADSIYGERVAHGQFTISLVVGMLSMSAPHIVGRGVPGAYFYSFSADYRGAVKVDDTISLRWRVDKKADAPGYEGFGLVSTAFEMINQDGDSVCSGTIDTLVRKESARDAVLHLKAVDPWRVEEYVPDPEKFYYAEDYPLGKGGETEGRTITETDIVNFAGLTGDYSPRYVDAEFARGDIFGERVAHGMLIFSIARGSWGPHFDRYQRPKESFAGHLNDKASFLLPVRMGDTIRCQYKTAARRASKSRSDVCIITFEYQVLNQRNKVVQTNSMLSMMLSRGGLSSPGA
jgi:acyl dehydratase